MPEISPLTSKMHRFPLSSHTRWNTLSKFNQRTCWNLIACMKLTSFSTVFRKWLSCNTDLHNSILITIFLFRFLLDSFQQANNFPAKVVNPSVVTLTAYSHVFSYSPWQQTFGYIAIIYISIFPSEAQWPKSSPQTQLLFILRRKLGAEQHLSRHCFHPVLVIGRHSFLWLASGWVPQRLVVAKPHRGERVLKI